MRALFCFGFALAVTSVHAAQDGASKLDGFERIAPSMFSAQCLNAENREDWSDHSIMRQRYRIRKGGATKSLSGLPIFEDRSLTEYALDGRGVVTGGAGADRTVLLGGIRTSKAQQFCYLNFVGSDGDKLTAALRNERIRPRIDSSVGGELESYCSNRLRLRQTSHEIFVFTDVAVEDASRSELVVRFDLAEGSTSCL